MLTTSASQSIPIAILTIQLQEDASLVTLDSDLSKIHVCQELFPTISIQIATLLMATFVLNAQVDTS
jgi:hypothetical protein